MNLACVGHIEKRKPVAGKYNVSACGCKYHRGFVSTSHIFSAISGNVACGPITSLFNTNPLPLTIIGAPSLTYFTNPKATITQIDSCGITTGYDYRIALRIQVVLQVNPIA